MWCYRPYRDATTHRLGPTCTAAFGFNRPGAGGGIVTTRQFKEAALTSIPPYYAPQSGHPPQSDLLTDRAVVTEAYTVIPKGVLRDIVIYVLVEWKNTRAWYLIRPVVGGVTTFAQLIVEVQPGGGSTRPEPQREVEGFLFVLDGSITVQHEGQTHELSAGGFAFLPPGVAW